MAKPLNQIAGYQPRAEGEKRFVRKHLVQNTPDANKNKDDVFDGSNVKTYEREKGRHGYNPDSDANVYEEVEYLEDELLDEQDED